MQTILEQSNEERAFNMYLAYSSNMMNEPISFSDYLNNMRAEARKKSGTSGTGENGSGEFMTRKEVEKFIEKSNLQLKNFTPPAIKRG